jgi:hypothetical protein
MQGPSLLTEIGVAEVRVLEVCVAEGGSGQHGIGENGPPHVRAVEAHPIYAIESMVKEYYYFYYYLSTMALVKSQSKNLLFLAKALYSG